MQVLHQIVLDPVTHQDKISGVPDRLGWVEAPQGGKELRRIPYLSELRNLSLRPLIPLRDNGSVFDKILFLNDVVFNVADVHTLLETNTGSYAAACGLDYSKPPKFYDTFALRDSEGSEAIMQTWPYFRSRESRNAMKAMRPVKVASCWNGMVVMDALPFYDSVPLTFRAIPDSLAQLHLEGSECCLIHYDNQLTMSHGVYVNPQVRVGYDGVAYERMAPQDVPSSLIIFFWRAWENRLRRWFARDCSKRRLVQSRLHKWETASADEGRLEMGVDCLIDEMQVLVSNGWAHL